MFKYGRRIQFYETDLMKIVHHGNYLRLFEEARVAWAAEKGLLDWADDRTASHLAVIKTEVAHRRPARFGDEIEIELQVQIQGIRLKFEYKMMKGETLLAEARTEHVSLDEDMAPKRPPLQLTSIMKEEKWNATWLSNL